MKILFIFSLVALVIFFLTSLYSFLFEVEFNKCEMTYMFQYPQYLPVKLPTSVKRKFPEYNLFVYTEGHHEPVSRSIYEGIPLLFIPGNDGSHKQVRSLASVAIQMRKSLSTNVRFDCFSVDLNSEFSAFHGPYLYRQSQFVQHVVDHIESLYPGRSRFSIVLVGHSMGGLVARHAMTLDGFDRGRVPLIVTLATPHQRPVLYTDSHMSSFYAEMNAYWRVHQATSLGHVAVVSVGGGDRDIEVALSHTRLDGLVLPRNYVWASASYVRDAWASTDHRCIVWCKQLVIAICKSLFALSLGKNNDGFNGGAVATIAEFRRRLLPATPSSAELPPKPSVVVHADYPARWFYRDLSDSRQRAFRFERDRLAHQIFVKILAPTNGRLLAQGESAVFLLDGSNGGDDSGWLFACLDPPVSEEALRNSPCATMAPLDGEFGRDLPPSGLRRRLARVDANSDSEKAWWRNATAFVAVLGPASEQTELHFDISSSGSRSFRLETWPFSPGSMLHLPAGSLYQVVRLSPPVGLTGRGLEVTLESHSCRAIHGSPGCLAQEASVDSSGSAAPGGYTHAVQYFNQNVSLALTECGGGSIPVCRLHVVVNPLCEHTISVRLRPQLFGAAVLRESGDSLPSWAGLQILSALLSSLISQQSHQQQRPSVFASFISSPIPVFTCFVASLRNAVTSHGSDSGIGGLLRQLFAACLAVPFAVAILMSVAGGTAWLSLLMRLPRRLLLQRQGHSAAINFANFLSPFGCILALYLIQCHCAAAGIVFLLVAQLLKEAAAKLNLQQCSHPKEPPVADSAATGAVNNVKTSVSDTADEVESRILAHQSALAVTCALLAVLCGPSLFVWAKTLQALAVSGEGSSLSAAQLPVADPHYWLGIAFAVIYGVDSALLANRKGRFYAPPIDVSWPVAIGISVVMGSAASLYSGNYAQLCNLILLLFSAYTVIRIAKVVLTGRQLKQKSD